MLEIKQMGFRLKLEAIDGELGLTCLLEIFFKIQ